jgi:hypothetical protein
MIHFPLMVMHVRELLWVQHRERRRIREVCIRVGRQEDREVRLGDGKLEGQGICLDVVE